MEAKSKVLVWDGPTRVFHWTLALSFAGAFLTAESERWRDVHVLLGYTVLALVAFRLLWGLFGSRYARFKSFAYGPRDVLGYLKSLFTRSPRRYLGHNPAGSMMIYALLLLALATGISGYLHYNELGGEWLEKLHETLAYGMLGLVFVHIAGVVVSSLLHKENLVSAMVTGYKQGDPANGIRRARWLVAALLIGALTALWTGIVQVPEISTSVQHTANAERGEPDGHMQGP